MPTRLLTNTNHEFSNNLEAALRLGDLSMVGANIEWVKGLLLNNHQRLTETSLQEYLQAYHKVVKSMMDKRAAPILEWFNQLD